MNKTFLLALIMFIFAACFHSGAIAKQITDMTGRRVTVPETVNRVCCTSPPTTYMVYAMDPGLLAGLNYRFTKHEKTYLDPGMEDLPVVGGWFGQGRTPNLETLLNVRPDVIIAWYYTDSASNKKIEQILAPLGIPLVYVKMAGIQDYPKAFRFLGKLFNMQERAGKLADYGDQALAQLESMRGKLSESEKVSVYYAEGPAGLRTECSSSTHVELIPLCGAVNVHKCGPEGQNDGFGMHKVTIEQVLQYAPDAIITHNSTFYSGVFNNPRWKAVRAVQNRRVYKIPCSPFNWFDRPPSFMRLLGAKWLFAHLYPNHYQGGLKDEIRAFYRLFFGIKIDENAAGELIKP